MMPIRSIEFDAFEHDKSFEKRSMAFGRVNHIRWGKLIIFCAGLIEGVSGCGVKACEIRTTSCPATSSP